MSSQGGSSEKLDVLAVYSGKDEYVPSVVDTDQVVEADGRCNE